jgi:3-isopropylmalate/(R)-2-methylmalate dehydratase small subunit
VVGLKAVGIKAVIAKSFARIFYRSAINQGLLLIESEEAVNAYQKGDNVEVDAEQGKILINEQAFSFPTLPKEIIAIQQAGGLLPYTRLKLEGK